VCEREIERLRQNRAERDRERERERKIPLKPLFIAIYFFSV